MKRKFEETSLVVGLVADHWLRNCTLANATWTLKYKNWGEKVEEMYERWRQKRGYTENLAREFLDYLDEGVQKEWESRHK